jgi:transposase-like protein
MWDDNGYDVEECWGVYGVKPDGTREVLEECSTRKGAQAWCKIMRSRRGAEFCYILIEPLNSGE